jgi:NAD-dependent DNA ligase
VCSACPVIQFAGMKFCFTGESSRSPRAELEATVTRLGGSVVSAPSGKVDFLIVGADGNPCWAFACYGRKIEQAMALRKSGARIVLVHENDFYDAVADRS